MDTNSLTEYLSRALIDPPDLETINRTFRHVVISALPYTFFAGVYDEYLIVATLDGSAPARRYKVEGGVSALCACGPFLVLATAATAPELVVVDTRTESLTVTTTQALPIRPVSSICGWNGTSCVAIGFVDGSVQVRDLAGDVVAQTRPGVAPSLPAGNRSTKAYVAVAPGGGWLAVAAGASVALLTPATPPGTKVMKYFMHRAVLADVLDRKDLNSCPVYPQDPTLPPPCITHLSVSPDPVAAIGLSDGGVVVFSLKPTSTKLLPIYGFVPGAGGVEWAHRRVTFTADGKSLLLVTERAGVAAVAALSMQEVAKHSYADLTQFLVPVADRAPAEGGIGDGDDVVEVVCAPDRAAFATAGTFVKIFY